MSHRTRNLALAGGAVVAVGFVAVNLLMAPAASVGVAPPAVTATAGAGPSAGPDQAAPGAPAAGIGVPDPRPSPALAAARRGYAIDLSELDGLPPDAAPGQPLELWVTWEPPVTRGPRLQKLIGDVVLERIVPGTVPEAPVTVLVSVPGGRVGDLIYADRFGRLSVVLPR